MATSVSKLTPGTVFVTADDRTGITLANEDLDDEAHFVAFLEPDERLVAEKFRATSEVRALFPLYPVVDGFDDLVTALRVFVKAGAGDDIVSALFSNTPTTAEGAEVAAAIAELCKLALAQAKK